MQDTVCMNKNDRLEVNIEGYTSEGAGVAKPGGYVLFIPNTVKGEREYLIPAVKGAFIHSVDLDANRMEIHVWEGLATDEH